MHFLTSSTILLSSFAFTQTLARIPCHPKDLTCGKPGNNFLNKPFLQGPPTFNMNPGNPAFRLPQPQIIDAKPGPIGPVLRNENDGIEVLKKRNEFSVLPKRAKLDNDDEAKTIHILPVDNYKEGAPARKFDDTNRRPIIACEGTGAQCIREEDSHGLPNIRYTREVEDVEEVEEREVPTPKKARTILNPNSAKFRNRLPYVNPQPGCTSLKTCSQLPGDARPKYSFDDLHFDNTMIAREESEDTE